MQRRVVFLFLRLSSKQLACGFLVDAITLSLIEKKGAVPAAGGARCLLNEAQMKDKGRALHLGIEIKNPLGCPGLSFYFLSLRVFCGLVWLCGVVCVLVSMANNNKDCGAFCFSFEARR